jgi:UTP-glucose-1-phosphate uridylyltransferase
MRAVVMAGGRGTRMLPYTTVLPKPLLPLGEHEAATQALAAEPERFLPAAPRRPATLRG